MGAALTATIVCFGGITSANAADSPTAAESVGITADERANLGALIAATENSDPTAVSFDAQLALELGASDDAITQYGAAFETRDGDQPATDASTARQATAQVQAAWTACGGYSGYIGLYWFGSQIALNSCATDAFINGISLAAAGGGGYAAASALTVAGLPSSAVVGVVAAVLALGIVFLNICRDSSSNGAIYLNGSSPLAPPTCWGQ